MTQPLLRMHRTGPSTGLIRGRLQRRRWLAWLPLAGVFAVAMMGCSTRSTTPVVATPDVSSVAAAPIPSALPEGWYRGAMMQIFVRAYQDSNGDGQGDLKGLTQRLDYLKNLGVKALVLMPVAASGDRDAGWDTRDPRQLEPGYGTLADFDELVVKAHALGLGVVLDVPFGHSSADHPSFVQARSDPKSPLRDWYVWSDEVPRAAVSSPRSAWFHPSLQPWSWTGRVEDLPKAAPNARGFYLATGGPQRPDFNGLNLKVLDYHVANLRFWLNRGVDGFRFSNVDQIVKRADRSGGDALESKRLVATLADEVYAYPNKYVLCDGQGDPKIWADRDVCGAAVSHGHIDAIVAAARGDMNTVRTVAEAPRGVSSTLAAMVSNHSRSHGLRLWDRVGGDVAGYKLAAATYLLQPATPLIHYGEELGMASLSAMSGDEANLGPMSWAPPGVSGAFTSAARAFRPAAPNAATFHAATQQEDRESIHTLYRELLALRHTRPSLEQGVYEQPFVHARQVMGFQRATDNERTLVLVNYGRSRVDVEVTGLPRRARMAPIYPRSAGSAFVAEVTLADTQGRSIITMQPRSVRLFDVEQALKDIPEQTLPPEPPRRRRR